jgi:Xaa-Pro aminopeptidase
MKYKNIGSELFTKNRKKFANKMNAGSIAIFHSNNQMPRNGDAHHKFKQNSDVFYLTGVDQEDTALVIFPDCPNPAYREMLFIKETSETIAVWDGAKLTPEEAKDQTGVTSVFWHHEFWNTIHAIILMADNIYVNLNENDRFPNKVSYNGIEVAHQLKRAYPSHRLLRSAPILTNLRTVKEPEEIALIKEATRITKIGLNKILKYTKPGVKEYEIEADLIY